MSYYFIHLDIENKDPDLTNEYRSLMKDSVDLYQRISSTLEVLTQICFHYSLFHGRHAHLSAWLSKTRKQLDALRSSDNDSLKTVMLRLMKLKDLNKKMTDKRHYKEQFLQGSKKLATLLQHDSTSQSLIADVTSRWNSLARDVVGLREDLEEMLYQLKDMTSQCDYLNKWLQVVEDKISTISISLDDSNNNILDDQIKDNLLQLKMELADKEEDLDRIIQLKTAFDDKITSHQGSEVSQTVKQIHSKLNELQSLVDSKLENYQQKKDLMEDSRIKGVIDAIQSNLHQTEDEVINQHGQTTLLSSSDVQREISNLQVRLEFSPITRISFCFLFVFFSNFCLFWIFGYISNNFD